MDTISRRRLLAAFAAGIPTLASGSDPVSIDPIARGLAAEARSQIRPRVVSTRNYQPSASYSGNKSIQSRVSQYARDYVRSVQVALPNYYVQAGQGETAPGATATIAASIEYPAGTFAQLTFSGATSAVIPNGGFILTDAAAVDIPANAPFWVRMNYYCATGIIYSGLGGSTTFAGDGAELSASPQADKTMSGCIAASNTLYMPLAVIAATAKPGIMLIGDSIMFGAQDTFNDAAGDQGIVARSVGPHFGYTNFGVSGDTITAMLANCANRLAFSRYYSHVVSDYGGPNDYGQGATTVIGEMQTLGALFPGLRRLQTTRVTNSTSTDGFASVSNQSTNTSAFFSAVNQAIRAGMQNWEGYLDVGAVLESSPGSGKWTVGPNGTGALTPDGVHPNTLGNTLILRSGVVRPETFQ